MIRGAWWTGECVGEHLLCLADNHRPLARSVCIYLVSNTVLLPLPSPSLPPSTSVSQFCESYAYYAFSYSLIMYVSCTYRCSLPRTTPSHSSLWYLSAFLASLHPVLTPLGTPWGATHYNSCI